MKTRSEIIRALIEPVKAALLAGKLEGDLAEVLTDIYNLAGHNDNPDELAKLIYAARSAAFMQPEYDQIFRSIASIAQDELLTRHRAAIKNVYRLKKDLAHAWLSEYVGSEELARSIAREVEDESSDN